MYIKDGGFRLCDPTLFGGIWGHETPKITIIPSFPTILLDDLAFFNNKTHNASFFVYHSSFEVLEKCQGVGKPLLEMVLLNY